MLQALRDATRAAHGQIEQVPVLARLLAADLTRGEYAQTLARLHGFHAALEPRLAAALGGLPAAAPLLGSGRVLALAADLQSLGCKVPRPAPRWALPALPDAAAALGCLYVAEGSALGGRVIARRLAETVGLGPEDGAGFFGGLTADAARTRWAALCALLEGFGEAASPAQCQGLLTGAIACFGRLGAWLAPPEPGVAAPLLPRQIALDPPKNHLPS
jgi:heme oxygenase